MRDDSRLAVGTSSVRPPSRPTPHSEPLHRVGWGFITLYTLAFMSTTLVLIAPLLVTLALKVNSLVGIEEAPNSLALVTGVGALLAMFGNPFFGRLSDRTTSRLGMRRPWMVIGLVGGFLGILVVALAPNIPIVLVGWCIAQLFFNALLAAQVAVLPDQVPVRQRGLVSGLLGICVPIASVSGTFLVKLFTGNQLAMFLVPCAIGDPLTDVALLLVYQRLADLESGYAVADASTAPGFLSNDDMLTRYADRSGRDLSAMGFYLGLAYFKIAVILEGIHYRYIHGQTVGAGFDTVGAVVEPLIQAGITSLKEHP